MIIRHKNFGLSVTLLAICIFFCSCTNANSSSNNGITVTSSLTDSQVLVGSIPCTFPLVTEDTLLNIIISGHADVMADDVYVWNKYEEMTGVRVNWTTAKKTKRDEIVYSALLNKNKIDLIMRCRISASKLAQYGGSGLILDLAKDDLLKNNAPNCWAFLQAHPEALASITNPDGTIYALPQVNSGAELRVARKIFINKVWLENVHMDVPTTTEELYQVLKAFKEQDANGNGDPGDEIPFCSQDWLSIRDAFFGAFGLASRGIHNQTVDIDEATGQLRFIEGSDDYRALLEYLNRLYSEGLLDKYTFTITMEQWTNNAENDRFGAFANTNLAGLPADRADNWIAVDEALEGPNGDKLWSAIRADFHSTGAAVIPSTCSDPELVLRWLDYFWTDEGTLFYHMGIEGETFLIDNDGSYDYAPALYEEMKTSNLPFDDIIAKYSPYPGGGNPTVEIAPYFKGGEMAYVPAEAARKLFKYGPKEYWPSFTFTSEENERLDILKVDLIKYCDSMRIDFITGVSPFSDWDSYLKHIEQLRKDELLDIYQAAVDRYYELKSKD